MPTAGGEPSKAAIGSSSCSSASTLVITSLEQHAASKAMEGFYTAWNVHQVKDLWVLARGLNMAAALGKKLAKEKEGKAVNG
jgi:hypothetical protein